MSKKLHYVPRCFRHEPFCRHSVLFPDTAMPYSLGCFIVLLVALCVVSSQAHLSLETFNVKDINGEYTFMFVFHNVTRAFSLPTFTEVENFLVCSIHNVLYILSLNCSLVFSINAELQQAFLQSIFPRPLTIILMHV